MSLFTEKMKMLTAVVLDSYADKVVKALLEKGVMDFVHIGDFDKDKVSRLQSHVAQVPKAAIADMRERAEAMFRQASLPLPSLDNVDLDTLPKLDMDSYRKALDRLTGSLSALKEEQKGVSQKLISINEIEGYIKDKKSEYLDLRVGTISHGKSDDLRVRLAPFAGVFLDEGTYLISLTLRRDSARVTAVMDKFSWAESSDLDNQKKALELASEKLEADKTDLTNKSNAISESVKDKILEKKDDLVRMWITLRVSELCEHIESYFSYTRNTTLFSGWVPSSQADIVEKTIYEASEGKCIIEWTSDSEVDRDKIPVAVTSPKLLEPFERIVNNYATPEYGSINPTIFTAVAYILMFMLMFADVGQGFILLLIGIIGRSYYKKHPLVKDGLISRYLCSLLLYLGPASMVGGALFGSYFGYSLFPAIWFNYHAVVNGHVDSGLVRSIYDILGITIKFGIIIIYTGLLLNWINLARKKRFLELIFDKNGFVGGWLYGVGIWACYYFVGTGYKSFPSSPFLVWGIVIPLIMLVVKGPIYAHHNAKSTGHKEGAGKVIMDTLMDFLVEVLEIFSGFLSNTLSFMRVAGLGIAHVSLMTAFEDIANMTGNIFAYIVIMIIGNVLVIALEGLSAGIQSLRLNYYEFFTKYFTGHGIAYEPVGLKSRIRIE